MKKLINLTVMCIVAIAALAQEKTDILVSYESVSPNKLMKPVKSKMSLLVSSTEAKWFNDLSLWVDSLKSSPEGKAQYMEILKKSCMTEEPDGSTSWDLSKGPVKKHTPMCLPT